jgi:hypothetical protein
VPTGGRVDRDVAGSERQPAAALGGRGGADRSCTPVDRRTEKPPSAPAIDSGAGFAPVALAPKSEDSAIRLEMRRGSSTVIVQWLASTAQVCGKHSAIPVVP